MDRVPAKRGGSEMQISEIRPFGGRRKSSGQYTFIAYDSAERPNLMLIEVFTQDLFRTGKAYSP